MDIFAFLMDYTLYMLLNLFFNLILKHIFFNAMGVLLTFPKLMKNPFYTLNINRITKTPRVQCKKYIKTAYETKKNQKILCNHGEPFTQILRKKNIKTCAGKLGHLTLSHRFLFLFKFVIDTIKMSMTFLFFA